MPTSHLSCRAAVLALAAALASLPAQAQQAGDAGLAAAAADALARGCDLLDPAHCLYPFPSDHYTAEIPGAEARSQNIHTGRRVNFHPLATPRNLAQHPVDPTEWNRNDGFSPGSMIVTYVPGLDRAGLLRSFGFTPGAQPDADRRVGITNPAITLDAKAPIQVLDALTGERHPVWAEMDVNAGYILPKANELGGNGLDRPQGGRSALILRPARNFTPGRRYVVLLQNLRTAAGDAIPAGAAYAICRDQAGTSLPPLQQRCAALEAKVFPVLAQAGIARAQTTLAWDFTVASAQNLTARLTHMRDDAFRSLAKPGSAADCGKYDYAAEPRNLSVLPDRYIGDCAAPAFTVDSVKEVDDGQVVEIQGTLKLPSYLIQPEPSPLEAAELNPVLEGLKQVPGAAAFFDNDLFFTAAPFNLLPPQRLNYNPADNTAPPLDPDAVPLLPYGDGLPDRVAGRGEMTTRWLCEVKKSILQGSEAPARPSLYGHGLLQSRAGLTYDEGRRMVKRNNFMLCGLDWFGFSQGDLHNVAVSLIDMSHFPAIPDASLQGMLNFMFMARLMQHPAGLGSHPAFQVNASGLPAFDRREIFYYGNSQGGILPGPVVAVSKDINRAVFGVPGMNYSTLLRRSTDFTLYSIPLYLSYQDELERNLIFGMMQMIWDRGENNGYAPYLTPQGQALHGGLPAQANLDGQDNYVMLHPAFSDHQVSYWTADVMARTMGARSDRQQLLDDPFSAADASKADPDLLPYFGYRLPDYDAQGVAPAGPVEVVWRRPQVKAPPVVELPPGDEANGPDPHGYPRNHATALCQMSQFLRSDGYIADVFPLWLDAAGNDRKDDNAAVLAECAQRFRPAPLTSSKAAFGAPDADVDGVADAQDQCPATAAGAAVNAAGCSAAQRDDDGDGVVNAADQCPLTPAGAAVDGSGCALSQLDGDGDGVSDANDLCPASPAGSTVGADGCPVVAGRFNVDLSASPAGGDLRNGPVDVTFTASAENTHANAGTLRYVFYFGDGENSGLQTAPSATHRYARSGVYQARVIVMDAAERTAEDSVSVGITTGVVVDPDPAAVVARLTMQLSGNRAPVTAMFDASGSDAPAGALYAYSFGDGQSRAASTNATASHVYPVAGDYRVTLTVTDPNNAASSDSVSADITIGSGQQTTVQLVVTPTQARIGQSVRFDASASLPAEGASITGFSFDFGDGSPVVSRSVAAFGSQAGIASHAYSRAGNFTPVVAVSDNRPMSVSKSLRLTVTGAAPVNAPPAPAGNSGGALGATLLLPLLLALRRPRRA